MQKFNGHNRRLSMDVFIMGMPAHHGKKKKKDETPQNININRHTFSRFFGDREKVVKPSISFISLEKLYLPHQLKSLSRRSVFLAEKSLTVPRNEA